MIDLNNLDPHDAVTVGIITQMYPYMSKEGKEEAQNKICVVTQQLWNQGRFGTAQELDGHLSDLMRS